MKPSDVARKFVYLLMTVVAIGMMAACGKTSRTAYSHFEKIGSEGWDPADIISFEPFPADSSEAKSTRYRLELTVRYSTRRSIPDLPLAISTEDENGEISADTIRLKLFTPEGDPLGMGSNGVREQQIVIEENLRLTDGFAVNVSSLRPREDSRGLLNIGARLLRQ